MTFLKSDFFVRGLGLFREHYLYKHKVCDTRDFLLNVPVVGAPHVVVLGNRPCLKSSTTAREYRPHPGLSVVAHGVGGMFVR